MERHRRRSIRLPDYDYASDGAYFVTVVCEGRALRLVDPRLHSIVDNAWRWLADRYPHVTLDEYAVMPNHLHGVLFLGHDRRGGSRTAPTPRHPRKPLGRLVGAFKTVSTKRINSLVGTPGRRFWQRNYYEHIVRDEDDLNRIREYIQDNPERWAEDPENPHGSEPTRSRRPEDVK